MDMLLIAGLLIGLAILVVFIGVARTLEPPSSERLQDYISDQSLQSLSRPSRRDLGTSAGELVQGFDKILRSVSAADRLGYALQRAGLRLTVTEFLIIWLFSTAAATFIGYFLSRSWLPAIMIGLFGAMLPFLFVRLRQGSRLRAFNDQLGNVLMQMSGGMRAGYGLLQAIDFVAREMPPPAGTEFAQVVRDVKLGRSVMTALEDFSERTGSDDLALIVTAIGIHYETGGNLSEILEMAAETIRERVRIKGELRSLTAQQRYSGYVLAGLPICMFFTLMLINPSYESRLFSPGPTLCIPIGALFSMFLGFLAIRRIVSIEV